MSDSFGDSLKEFPFIEYEFEPGRYTSLMALYLIQMNLDIRFLNMLT